MHLQHLFFWVEFLYSDSSTAMPILDVFFFVQSDFSLLCCHGNHLPSESAALADAIETFIIGITCDLTSFLWLRFRGCWDVTANLSGQIPFEMETTLLMSFLFSGID